MPDLGYQQVAIVDHVLRLRVVIVYATFYAKAGGHTFVPVVTFRYSVAGPAEICRWVLRTIHSSSVVWLRCVTILCHGLRPFIILIWGLYGIMAKVRDK